MVPYNPNDPLQQELLATIAAGESGGQSNPYFVGVGGPGQAPTDLSGDTNLDQYGFPQWGGYGNSHAAGAYQFQPGTWDRIAAQFGLNFQDPTNQDAGAWYLAQQTYAQQTGGNDLETALANGNLSGITSALSGQWTSLATGSPGSQTGLVGQGLQQAAGAGNNIAGVPTDIIGKLQLWASNLGLSLVWVVIGIVFLIGGLWIMARDSGVLDKVKDAAGRVATSAAIVAE